MKFRCIPNPNVILEVNNQHDIEQMLLHSEYEKVEEEPKQEVKRVGRPKKADTGEE
jgi:hypothetical protein